MISDKLHSRFSSTPISGPRRLLFKIAETTSFHDLFWIKTKWIPNSIRSPLKHNTPRGGFSLYDTYIYP